MHLIKHVKRFLKLNCILFINVKNSMIQITNVEISISIVYIMYYSVYY